MTNLNKATLAATALSASLLVPIFALAQVPAATNVVPTSAAANITTSANADAGGAHVRAKVMASSTADTTRAARAKDKASQEIDRRIAALNSLLARVQSMGKVSDALKANLKTNIQTEIDGFTGLKAKIEADTDLATLKADVQSITQSYRIFMLVMPQGRIAASADRAATIISMMAGIGTKLQARINAATQGGSDTTALAAAITDLVAKLSSAQTHAQLAVTIVGPLVPDNGDKTVMASNDAALKKANDELKAAQADLASGRKDIETIVKGLRSLKPAATASSTMQVSQ